MYEIVDDHCGNLPNIPVQLLNRSEWTWQRRPAKNLIRNAKKADAKGGRKAKKITLRATRPRRYDPKLEFGLAYMRGGDSLAEAARKIGVTSAKLRGYVAASGIAIRKRGKWHFKRDRRFRRMPLYSDGRRVVITVHNGKTASLIGSYMRAVRSFFDTEDIQLLDPFRDQSVPDVNGKRHVFETRPNILFRLDASGIEPFELVYEIVKRD